MIGEWNLRRWQAKCYIFKLMELNALEISCKRIHKGWGLVFTLCAVIISSITEIKISVIELGRPAKLLPVSTLAGTNTSDRQVVKILTRSLQHIFKRIIGQVFFSKQSNS